MLLPESLTGASGAGGGNWKPPYKESEQVSDPACALAPAAAGSRCWSESDWWVSDSRVLTQLQQQQLRQPHRLPRSPADTGRSHGRTQRQLFGR